MSLSSGRRAHPRVAYLAFVALAIGVGLAVNRGRALPPAARDVAGDALWAAMMAGWIGAVAPRWAPGARTLAAYGVCVAVELSQLYHTPALDHLRRTPMGRLVLGSGFDARDLAAYAAGVLAAATLEAALRPRAHP